MYLSTSKPPSQSVKSRDRQKMECLKEKLKDEESGTAAENYL